MRDRRGRKQLALAVKLRKRIRKNVRMGRPPIPWRDLLLLTLATEAVSAGHRRSKYGTVCR